MKLSSVASIVLAGSIAVFTGCGGGSSSSSSTAEKTKNVTIEASDAGVVNLPTPAKMVIGGKEYTTKNVNNGVITFKVPSSVDDKKAEFLVPGDAIVDTDGDGKLSKKDHTIRMALKTIGSGTVANPLTTLALAKGDMATFELVKNFNPVKAKLALIKGEGDEKLKALVSASDVIADLMKSAKTKGVDTAEVLKKVDVKVVKEVAEGKVTDTKTLTESLTKEAAVVAGTTTEELTKKAEEIVQTIEKAKEAVKKGVSATEALIAVIAVSDAGVDATSAITALESGDVSSVISSIVEDSKVADIISEETKPETKPESKSKTKSTTPPSTSPSTPPSTTPSSSSNYDNNNNNNEAGEKEKELCKGE